MRPPPVASHLAPAELAPRASSRGPTSSCSRQRRRGDDRSPRSFGRWNRADARANVVGPFLLTNLLIALLRKSTPARIINVSCGVMYPQKLRADDLKSQRREWDPGVVEAERVVGEAVGEGTEFRLVAEFLGRKNELSYRIVEYDPPRAVAFLGENASVALKGVLRIAWRDSLPGCRPGRLGGAVLRA